MLLAAFFFDEFEDVADVLLVGEDFGDDDGLFDFVDGGGVGPAAGVLHVARGAAGEVDFVADAGGGGDEVEAELALEALLNDFHVEEAEEAAAEAEAEGDGGFGLEGEAGVVELEFS